MSIDHELAEEILERLERVERLLLRLLDQEIDMADATQEALDALSAKVDEHVAADGAAAAEFAELAAEIHAIVPGTTVTPEQVTALASKLEGGLTTLTAAASAAKAPPAAAEASAGAPPAGEPPAAAPPADAGPPAAAGTPAAAKPLYVFDGDVSNVDSSWSRTDQQTLDGKPLFTAESDQAGQPATMDGAGGVWHVYVGETQPVPASG